ncbi:MAG TPA: YihY/virulence factor BrkB family protein [Marmoricola sp.]|nr:YihY/virulence factor BrkB family protein [Marmoricola sp.]
MGLFAKKTAEQATIEVPAQATASGVLELDEEIEATEVIDVPKDAQPVEATEAIEIPPGAIRTDEADEPAALVGQEEPGAWLDQQNPEDFQGPKRGMFFVLRRTVKEFIKDQSFDMAAALTYYSIFAIFPAMIALFSLIGLVSNPNQVIDKISESLEPLVRDSTRERVINVLEGVSASSAVGIGIAIGLVLALWSASAYTNAFRRMMNRIYDVQEGRPIWKLRPMMLLVTLASLTLVTVSLLLMIITGPIAEAIGKTLGLGHRAALLWDLLKIPALLLIVVVVVALLYQTTPNIKLARFRVISAGSVAAIVAIVIASAGLAFYVRNIASYNLVYGSLAGVIVFLLWTWVINMSLLFGAELDAELERGRQLHDGLAAEEHLQTPLRDDRAIRKAEQVWDKIHIKDRSVREDTHGAGDLTDRPFTKSR